MIWNSLSDFYLRLNLDTVQIFALDGVADWSSLLPLLPVLKDAKNFVSNNRLTG
jgi:hypothetical protein